MGRCSSSLKVSRDWLTTLQENNRKIPRVSLWTTVPPDDCSMSYWHTVRWRDPTRSKKLSRVCVFGFQFGLYHVLASTKRQTCLNFCLCFNYGWLELSVAPTYTNSIFVPRVLCHQSSSKENTPNPNNNSSCYTIKTIASLRELLVNGADFYLILSWDLGTTGSGSLSLSAHVQCQKPIEWGPGNADASSRSVVIIRISRLKVGPVMLTRTAAGSRVFRFLHGFAPQSTNGQSFCFDVCGLTSQLNVMTSKRAVRSVPHEHLCSSSLMKTSWNAHGLNQLTGPNIPWYHDAFSF